MNKYIFFTLLIATFGSKAMDRSSSSVPDNGMTVNQLNESGAYQAYLEKYSKSGKNEPAMSKAEFQVVAEFSTSRIPKMFAFMSGNPDCTYKEYLEVWQKEIADFEKQYPQGPSIKQYISPITELEFLNARAQIRKMLVRKMIFG